MGLKEATMLIKQMQAKSAKARKVPITLPNINITVPIHDRNELAETELRILRTSIKRIAEATRDKEIIKAIPPSNEFSHSPYSERGWNALAAMLCGWCDAASLAVKALEKDPPR